MMSTIRKAVRDFDSVPGTSQRSNQRSDHVEERCENSETIKLLINKCMRWILLTNGTGNTFKTSEIMAYLKNDNHKVSRKDFQKVYQEVRPNISNKNYQFL